MGLYSDLNEVLTPYAQRIKGLKADLAYQQIPTNSDLNDYYETGKYFIGSASTVVANYPTDTVYSSVIEVEKLSNGLSSQIITIVGVGQVYMRWRKANGTWGAWSNVTPEDKDLWVRYDAAQEKTAEEKLQALTNIGGFGYNYVYPKLQNDNLSDITKSGIYVMYSNNGCTSVPDGFLQGYLLVIESDGGVKRQFLYDTSKQKLYFRSKTAAAVTYGDWFKIGGKKEISILFIGNSLTQDGIAYAPYILTKFFPDISFKFYMWYIAGASLETTYSYFTNGTPCQIFSAAVNSASWTNYSNSKTITDILTTYTFDIVSLQPYVNAGNVDDAISFTALNNVKTYIGTHYTGGNMLKFVTLAHSNCGDNESYRNAKYAKIVAINKQAMKDTSIEDVIPMGLSTELAFKTDLVNLGDNTHLSPDGIHTQEGLPCLLQTYTFVLWLLEKLGIQKSIYGCEFRMTTEIYQSINVPGENLGSGVITGTDAQNILAQEVAINAVKAGKALVTSAILSE